MATAKSSYAEKLRDPRWQKKRLEVFQRAEFKCEQCGDDESTLHVHHKQYIKGREPWDYEAGQLVCLCEQCHSDMHESEDRLNVACSYAELDGPNNRDTCADLISGFIGRPLSVDIPDPFAHVVGAVASVIYKKGYSQITDLADWLESEDKSLAVLGMILEETGR